MGFLNSLKKMFQGDSNSGSGKKEDVHCDELLRLISFAQKTKPLMGGNYGITVTYSPPNRDKGEYIAGIYAEFGFYDFDEIRFAREFALKAGHSDINAQMVKHYYDLISENAHLTRADWPYKMDEYDFARMLTNCDEFGFYNLIPDETNEDIFKMKIKAGFASQNGIVVHKQIIQKCRETYPNLKIDQSFAYSHKFLFTIDI